MKVLERYVLRKILVQTAAATMASLGIVWTIQALTKVNLVTDSGQSIGAFLLLSTMLIPAIIPIVLPFAVLIATTNTLNTMNTDSELAVIHAAGAKRSMVFKPILIVALMASIATALVANFVEPYARQSARSLVAEARADLISLLIQEGSFKKIDTNIYMQVDKRLANGRLGGLFIADSRDPKTDQIYYAREGAIVKDGDTNLLVMNDGEIQSRVVATNQLSIIRFTSYAFDMSEFTASSGQITLLPKDQTTQYLLSPDANDKIFQRVPLQFSAELHGRITEWLYSFVFAMIAIAICGMARSHRDNPLLLTFNAVALAFIARWCGLIGENRIEQSAYAIPIVYLVPIVCLSLASLSIWRDRTIALSKRKFLASEHGLERVASVVQQIGSPFRRLLPQRWSAKR
jgi:lipopolysaccharide export system permease protein